jgi:hypothetical protein
VNRFRLAVAEEREPVRGRRHDAREVAEGLVVLGRLCVALRHHQDVIDRRLITVDEIERTATLTAIAEVGERDRLCVLVVNDRISDVEASRIEIGGTRCPATKREQRKQEGAVPRTGHGESREQSDGQPLRRAFRAGFPCKPAAHAPSRQSRFTSRAQFVARRLLPSRELGSWPSYARQSFVAGV